MENAATCSIGTICACSGFKPPLSIATNDAFPIDAIMCVSLLFERQNQHDTGGGGGFVRVVTAVVFAVILSRLLMLPIHLYSNIAPVKVLLVSFQSGV